jgi:serine/threonine protein phosphatase PrpC
MMLDELRSSFSRSFLNIQKSLTARKQVDVTFSGTTVNLVYIHSNVVICANLGDSRAVIGRKSPDSQWNAVEISKDHKPDDDEELKRIRARGGRVEPVLDAQGKPVGPPRVWLKNEPLPGLAMSRSIGDFIASTVGVIAEPDIRTFTLTEDDKFLIMATDGVWEFVNSNACVRIVAQGFEKGNSEKAAEDLLKFAVEMWTNNEKSVDDITIIIVFFDLVNHSN